MTGIHTLKVRQIVEAMTPPEAIAKNGLGAWCVTLTDEELAILLTKIVTESSTRLLQALDCMDHGCREPGFQGHENGLGDGKAGDELQAAREELERLVGHTKVPEPTFEE